MTQRDNDTVNVVRRVGIKCFVSRDPLTIMTALISSTDIAPWGRLLLGRRLATSYLGVILAVVLIARCQGGVPGDLDSGLKATGWKTDWGTVQQGQKVTKACRLTNISRTHRTIEKVRTNCGCISADTPDRTVAPGATLPLHVTYDASESSRTGQENIRVFVVVKGPTDGDAMGLLMLEAKIHVSRDIAIVPKRVSFGRVPIGTVAERQVQLAVKKGVAVTWGTLGYEAPIVWASLKHAPAIEVAGRKGTSEGIEFYVLQIRAHPKSKLGLFKTRVKLPISAESGDPREIAIPVGGRVVADVTVSPPVLFCGYVKRPTGLVRRIELRSSSARAFSVLSVALDGLPADAGVTHEVVETSAGEITLETKLDLGTSPSPTRTGHLVVKVSGDPTERVVLPVVAVVRPDNLPKTNEH